MAMISINNEGGLDLTLKTVHVGNYTASTQNSSTTNIKYLDGWEIVASGVFTPIVGAGVNTTSGIVTSFQVFGPSHNLEFSGTSSGVDVGTFCAYAGLASSIYGFDDLIHAVVANDNKVSGGAGTVIGGTGDDTLHLLLVQPLSIDGGAGIDTVTIDMGSAAIVLSSFFSQSASGYSINPGAFGASSLSNIERLEFFDGKTFALDLTPDGHAGQAMEFIGVVAPSLLNDTAIRGLIISLLDNGNSMEQLCQLALDQNLLPNFSNIELARNVYHNVLDDDADSGMTDALVGYIETHGQVSFLTTVAGLHLNVDLVGLQQTGVEYLV